MKIYILQREQFIPASPAAVWAYFSDPRNLNALTPPDVQFEVQREDQIRGMYAGQMLEYRIRILPGIRVRWLTEIRQVVNEQYFLDEQRFGPYRLWHHQHHFRAVPGGVEMKDEVHYALGFGFIGSLVQRIWVGPQLEKIFNYRRMAVGKIFPTPRCESS